MMATAAASAKLRRYRRALVLSAEKIVGEATARGDRLPAKAQFSHLVALCGEASCGEEIENFLRYQAGRRTEGGDRWTPVFAKAVIAGLRDQTRDLHGEDASMVEAWRLYALYLKRAFTYQDATSSRRARRDW